MFIKIFLCTFFSLPLMAQINGMILDVAKNTFITSDDFLMAIKDHPIIVLGEKHYCEKVQEKEGDLIEAIVKNQKAEGHFSLSWEFLNASEQENTAQLFAQRKTNAISDCEFLMVTQNYEKACIYAPMIKTTALLNGQLFGVNLSREEKAPVVKNGLSALDPKLLPVNFQLGNKRYFDRFEETMKGHATPSQINNYFAAQSLVDDVSAYHMATDDQSPLKFLVIGAFHSGYNDGVIERLKFRNPSEKVVNIEIVDASDYTREDLKALAIDPLYGARADYLVFVNEPSEAFTPVKRSSNALLQMGFEFPLK